ncbi:hypothetical protein AVEN_44307-1 [Araneus ventricosus]|uniref:Uncharacterized protein n=1 Tax=Araneus ventricosus TaxID=182803 RepID=A0A4Y2DRG2_ARAVE|nr:hypothetical protein AVEN_44307-1 [Araneus ventricosus]
MTRCLLHIATLHEQSIRIISLWWLVSKWPSLAHASNSSLWRYVSSAMPFTVIVVHLREYYTGLPSSNLESDHGMAFATEPFQRFLKRYTTPFEPSTELALLQVFYDVHMAGNSTTPVTVSEDISS